MHTNDPLIRAITLVMEQSDTPASFSGRTDNMHVLREPFSTIKAKRGKEFTIANAKRGTKVVFVGDTDANRYGHKGVVSKVIAGTSKTQNGVTIKLDIKIRGTQRNLNVYEADFGTLQLL